MSEPVKWQPVLLYLNKRLECECGALAVIVTGRVSGDASEYNSLEDTDVWCQSCFLKAQERV